MRQIEGQLAGAGHGLVAAGAGRDLAGGKAARVVAILSPLAAPGRARIVEPSGRALDVLVDNGLVGKTPWEGRLPVGEHVIVLRGAGDLGTAPVSITVQAGRTLPLTLAAEELASAIRVVPTPANALMQRIANEQARPGAPPKSVAPVAADWMLAGPLMVLPTQFSFTSPR